MLKRTPFLTIHILFFIILFFFMGFHRLWFKEPQSIHAWRQSDSYAITLNYYLENHNLWNPHLFYTSENGDRQAVSEFPIIYYIVGKIWKITGESPGIFRLINLLIFWIGLYHLLLLINHWVKDRFWSFAVLLFLYSSPIIGYYAFNFTPDVPALGLAMSGLYFLNKYLHNGKITTLIAACLFYTLASLLRITALLSILAVIFTLVAYYRAQLFASRRKLLELGLSLLVIAGVYFAWNRYANWYNQQHISSMFLQEILPIWKLNSEQIERIVEWAYRDIIPAYLNPAGLVFVISIFIFLLIRFNKVPVSLFLFTVFFGLGSIGLMLLFFKMLDVHDYFLTFSLLIIPAILTTALVYIRQQNPEWLNSTTNKILTGILLALLLNSSMIISRSHYNPHQSAVRNSFPLEKSKREYWDYIYWTMELQDFQYKGMSTYLRELHIENNDKIISLGDYSPNRTLVWMETQGFTYAYGEDRNLEAFIEKCIHAGARHLVYNENVQPDLEKLQPYLGKQIGQYNKIRVYEITH
ncbi:ArnT family glycosyltransferase [Mangrovibacterium lignilyticum]|uniref:ArnT family glycosyltransferase n=1 Tax=Mangrovibacterium lignilyticum TaxID=2668052 RepID=UPI0013D1684A|nr:glycosyltransferase family 39 protein [Mangrovibacterium lignilyticum]